MSQSQQTKRKLKLWEALALSLGLVGPTLAMSGNAQGLIDSVGKALPLVFLFGLIGVAFIAYGFIRLTSYYNHTGSAYALVGITIGPKAGFFSGFALLVTYLCFSIGTLSAFGAFTNAFLAALSPDAAHPFQIPWFITVLVGVFFSWLLNNRESRVVARVLMAIEGFGIVLMLILAAVILIHGGHSQAGTAIHHSSIFSLNGVSIEAVMGAVVAAFLSWAGFEACATLGEETDNPKRNIPLALLGSIVLTGALFILMMYVQVIGFGTDTAGLNAFKTSANSLGTLSEQYIGAAYGLLIMFTALMAALACHLSASATASRLLYALARDGFGHRSLATVNSHKQPHNALTVVLLVCTVVNFLSWVSGKPDMGTGTSSLDSYFYFAIIGSICLMITYLMVQFGVIRFILSAKAKIAIWEVIFPILGSAVMLVSLYFNFKGNSDLLSPPFVAVACCFIGLVIIILAPKLAQNIGHSLSKEFTETENQAVELTKQAELS